MSFRNLRWPALAALCLVAGVSVPAQFTPKVALTKFTVAPGLEISTWASEPLFVNPTCIDVDEGGRVWVCESVNYRNTLHGKPLTRPAGDRILVLEDTKGTGKADKVHVFYQAPNILAPLGICVLKDPIGPGRKVIVSQSPDIWVFEDKDGDFKADGPPKKLLTGFGGIDHDHGVHSCVVGPDRRLYFLIGDQGVHGLKGNGDNKTYTSNNTDCQAGTVWRCDLDGKNLTLIAHNFRNPYELAIDSFGSIFLSDNDDDGSQQTRICYIMPGGNYGYHPRGPGQTHWHEEQPGVVHKILRTYFGSPTGMCIYEGDLLPEKYRGFPLHVDAGPRQARSYMLKRAGAGYEVNREDIVNSTDNWFRPSDICVGPDGSAYIADWYDPGVGGHGMGDITRGRIYRLAPKGSKVANPKVDMEKPEGILAALGSPNLAIRTMAQTRLTQLKADEALKIVGMALESKNVYLQARAYWMSAVLFEHFNDRRFLIPLALALDSKDVRFRELFVRVCVDYLGKLPSEMFPGATEKVVADPSPAVRREFLLCLRTLPVDKAKDLIWKLAQQYDGKDNFYLHAIGIAVGQPTQPERRAAILADFGKHFATLDDRALDLVWELRPASVLTRLGEKIADAGLTPTQRGRIVDILASSADKDAGKAMLGLLRKPEVPAEVRAKVLENLKLFLPGKWQSLRTDKALDETVQSLLQDPALAINAVQLIGAARLLAHAKDVARVAADAKQSQPTRIAAITALGDLGGKDAVDALKALENLDGNSVDAYTPAIVTALGKLVGPKGTTASGKQALAELQGLLTAEASSPARRRAALEALVGTRPGTVWLLDLANRGKLPATIKADAGRMLRNTPYQDLRNKALVAFPVPGKLDLKKLPPIASLVQRKGNAEHGRKLMADSLKGDTQCLKCHTIRGIGGQVGPDLSMIGKKGSKENLFESILLPSKAIADQYVSWIVETKAGVVITGLLIEETPTDLLLRDANGKDTKIPKTEIDSRTKSLKSLMPEDVVVHLSEDDLVDLVAYLATLQTAAFAPDSWHILGPFPNGAGDAGLDKTLPGEDRIDLTGTYPGKNGKVSWRTVKPGATGYVDLQAFYTPNHIDITSLLTRDFESAADQKATLLLGADDAVKVWINGKLVHTSRDHAAATPAQYSVEVPLQKGTNRVVVKITNGEGAHGLFFTLLAGQELKATK